MHGILNLDKPAGPSSAAALTRVKRLLPRGVKVGHAGTLDPFASGVLVVLIGRATKQCESLMGLPKSYEATIQLGATTETDDLDSPQRPAPLPSPLPTFSDIERLLPTFVGDILQMPPAFSALKVGGRRAYQFARKGIIPALQPRTVRVYSLRLAAFEWPLLKVEVDSGRGFYVRALARDLGERLGTGGYLTALRRSAVGTFHVKDAVPLDRLNLQRLEAAVMCATVDAPDHCPG